MKKMILAAAVLALAGMNIPSAQAGLFVSVRLGVPLPVVTVGAPVCAPAPVYCPPQVYCPPAPCPRPAVIYAPPVVIVHPRPVCVTESRFGVMRGDRFDRRHDGRFEHGRHGRW